MWPSSKNFREPNTQGGTLDEARRNLREAVALTFEANRALSEEDLAGSDVIRGLTEFLARKICRDLETEEI